MKWIYLIIIIGMMQMINAIPSTYQKCEPNAPCSIGEYVLSNTFLPVNKRMCHLSVRYPNRSSYLTNSLMSNYSDGWYNYTLRLEDPLGIYPAIMCCNNSGDYSCIDKTFELGLTLDTINRSETLPAIPRFDLFDPGTYLRTYYNNTGLFVEINLSDGWTNGSYLCPIIALDNPAQWREIQWNSSLPTGTSLNVSVRSCDDSICFGEDFIDILDESPQINLTDYGVSNNSYFQCSFNFTTDSLDYSSRLLNYTITYVDEELPDNTYFVTYKGSGSLCFINTTGGEECLSDFESVNISERDDYSLRFESSQRNNTFREGVNFIQSIVFNEFIGIALIGMVVLIIGGLYQAI